jgi:cytosine/adenosine deaminase-related metal-dependent hydrolase
MPSYLITLTSEQMDGLRERSRETGLPVAFHVRQGVEWVLSGQKPVELTYDGHTVSGYATLIKLT